MNTFLRYVMIGMMLMFCRILAHGQELQAQQHLGLRLGIWQIKEKNLHTKVHQGTSLHLAYGKTRWQEQLTSFQVEGGFASMHTDYEDAGASLTAQLYLRYVYALPLYENEQTRLWIGPAAILNYQLSYYPNWDDSHLYQANYAALGAAAHAQFVLRNEKKLRLNLSLPLLAITSRPDSIRLYKIDDLSFSGLLSSMHENLNLSSFNRLQDLRLQAAYVFHEGEHSWQSLTYQFNYSKFIHPDSKPLVQLQHTLGIQLSF